MSLVDDLQKACPIDFAPTLDYSVLGSELDVEGSVLFYPWGGPDVYAPFNLSDNITSVLSHGKEPFGDIDSVLNAFRKAFLYRRVGRYVRSEDLHDTVKEFDAMGHFALYQICSGLRGKLLSLDYFSLDEDNLLDGGDAHVRIRFEHDGEEKNWTYLSGNMNSLDDILPFVNDFSFSTLMIKGATQWWSHLFTVDRVYDLAIDSAKKQDALIIADGNVVCEDGIYRGSSPRPIWCNERSFPAGDALEGHFGYDKFVWYGRGSEDVLSREEAYDLSIS